MSKEALEHSEAYWEGYHDGKISSLKHNIILMKSQIKVEEESYKNIKRNIRTDKKGKVLALRNLTADTKQFRGSKLGENMSEDADNESVGKSPLTNPTLDVVSRIDGGTNSYKRRFVEDDILLCYKEE